MWLSNFDFDIYNFMKENFKLYSASYRIGTFKYWLLTRYIQIPILVAHENSTFY